MLEFSVEVGGKKCRPGDIIDALHWARVTSLREAVEERAGDMVCPEHAEPPRVTVTNGRGDRIEFQVRGCCEAFQADVSSRIADLVGVEKVP